MYNVGKRKTFSHFWDIIGRSCTMVKFNTETCQPDVNGTSIPLDRVQTASKQVREMPECY